MRSQPLVVLIIFLTWLAPAGLAEEESKLDYTVALVDAAQHKVHVSMSFDPETAGAQIQLPVWNALYQVRDFAKNVFSVGAANPAKDPLPVRQVDKTTWEVQSRGGWVTVEYDVVADDPGPFGAHFDSHHAFFNLAEVLMYPTNGRELPITLRFTEVPARWKLATSLPSLSVPAQTPGAAAGHLLHARNYDHLVDSPCELSEFNETDFSQGGANYRVVIDAAAGDYDAAKLVESLRKITAAEIEWMNDRPFDAYVFIYHFPRGPAGGGMEHAYSTAIDMSAAQLKELKGFEATSAHEFFHLWNVKRIRPQSLEPIDYTRENYTRALWFSEGVTTTVADFALLRAGLLQPADYFQRLSSAITTLESRPARLKQSAEESSLDAWLEKYPGYRSPERSISYYNKGEILGVLLDLKIREDSYGRYSLRDLLQALNRDYAKQGLYFSDSDGVRAEAEKLAGAGLLNFFDQYVAGTTALPYAQLFSSVGLTLDTQTQSVADPGFTSTRSFNGRLVVDGIYGEQAKGAGLMPGDEIASMDGRQVLPGLEQQLAAIKPGTKVRLAVMSRGVSREVELTLAEKSMKSYVLRESPRANAAQLARRIAWLRSEDQGPSNTANPPAK